MIKVKKRVSIYEGPTGILELSWGDGSTETIAPITDLDSAIDLLHSFYFIKTQDNVLVKDAFHENSIDWFPTCISLLYWQYFYTYVKYRPLIDMWIQGKVDFSWGNKGALFNFLQHLEVESFAPSIFDLIFEKIGKFLVKCRNNIICKSNSDILFQRFSLNDFRTGEILNELRAENFSIVQLIPFSRKVFLNNFFDSKIIFTTGAGKVPIMFSNIAIADDCHKVMIGALAYTKKTIHGHRGRYDAAKKMLSRKLFRIYLGIDDLNWVYPYIYAAQDSGIIAYGIQHGVYAKRHIAYFMPHINRHRWYDKVLVWGSYWRSKILQNTSLYKDSFHLIARNKHAYDYTKLPKITKFKTVLIPYEFLADTYCVGRYINKFIENGFIVYFKVRPDEKIEEQISSYGIKIDPNRLMIVSKITPDLMADIDIVAGTQTTLLYDLLPFNKPTWILETEFHLLNDLVEDGLAIKFSMDDFNSIEDIYLKEISIKRNISKVDFSGEASVSSVLKTQLQEP